MDEHVFAGTLIYESAHAMEHAIDRFMKSKSILTPLAVLAFDGLRLCVEFRAMAYRGLDQRYVDDFAMLAEAAIDGELTVLDNHGRTAARIPHGGKPRAKLPARHRRWELFAGAKSVDALRALAADGTAMAQPLGPLKVTALHIAARAGAEDAVAFLLEVGVPVDAATIEKTTALAFASTGAVAGRLIAAGANIDGEVGDCAIVVNSARLDRGEVVRVLLQAGARVPDGSHHELAKALALAGDFELLRDLATGDDAFRTALAHDDVINAALRSDNEVALDLLLGFGAQLPSDFIGRAAAFGARTHLLAALRAADAVASAGPSSNDRDAMCLAAAYGRLEAMQLLADAGVPVEPRKAGATSPLIWSVWSAALDADACRATAAWLLERGASIDTVNARRRTALAFAVERMSRHGATFLVERGADLSLLSAVARRALVDLLPDELAARVRATAPAKKRTTKKPAPTKSKTRKRA